MSTIRRALRTFVVGETGQTLQGHAVGLLVGAGIGLLLWLLWRASPFILAGLFLLIMQADNGPGPSGGD